MGLNILMATNWFYPDKIGGAYVFIYELSKHLVDRGHNVYVLTGRDRNLPPNEMIDGIHVLRYNIDNRNLLLQQFSNIYCAFRGVNRLLQQAKVDIINTHQILSSNAIDFSRHTLAIPKVYTFHAPSYREIELSLETWRSQGLRNRIKSALMRVYLVELKLLQSSSLRKSQRIVTLSDYSRKNVSAIFQIPESAVEVIPAGVDIQRFYPPENKSSAKAKIGLDPSKFVVLTVRRLVPRMGIDNLLRAMVDVRKKIPNICALIVGTGAMETSLKTMAAELNLGGIVKFCGLVKAENLPDFYRAADLFVLPTRDLEGFGIATIESLACGTPVIGTAIGGTVEILTGLDEDLLIEGVNSRSIADAILKFYRGYEGGKQLSAKCRNYVLQNYTWEQAAARYEKIYIDVIRAHGKVGYEKNL